jgi:hypothetical protein
MNTMTIMTPTSMTQLPTVATPRLRALPLCSVTPADASWRSLSGSVAPMSFTRTHAFHGTTGIDHNSIAPRNAAGAASVTTDSVKTAAAYGNAKQAAPPRGVPR